MASDYATIPNVFQRRNVFPESIDHEDQWWKKIRPLLRWTTLSRFPLKPTRGSRPLPSPPVIRIIVN